MAEPRQPMLALRVRISRKQFEYLVEMGKRWELQPLATLRRIIDEHRAAVFLPGTPHSRSGGAALAGQLQLQEHEHAKGAEPEGPAPPARDR